jgi:hypothetical protein
VGSAPASPAAVFRVAQTLPHIHSRNARAEEPEGGKVENKSVH